MKCICRICGNEYDSDIEMFEKYHDGNICFNCSRKLFEEEIGYDDN